MRRIEIIVAITVMASALVASAQSPTAHSEQPLTRLPAVRIQAPSPRVACLAPALNPQRMMQPGRMEEIPVGQPAENLIPWWQAETLRPLRMSPAHLAVDVNSLIVDTLRHSAQVRAISDHMLIARTAVIRADAEFDVRAFTESKFVRTSIPTSSTLDAGVGVSRLREEDWVSSAGMRRKNRYGGQFEVAQRLGLENSNSEFFFPENQGNSRLTLSYNQPLLNGYGQAYNNSLIVLAGINTRIASQRSSEELQDHLLAVTETMWDLYRQRAVLLQKQRHLERAQVIMNRLQHRREIDSLASQIARARAAVSMRNAELIRASSAIRNAEARLRSLVNSPTMLADRSIELVPVTPPLQIAMPISMEQAVLAALEHRPEINRVSGEIEAARVRANIAKSELLPVLDLVLETYVSGLRGDYDVGQSWVDQFSRGEPSYTAGFVFEVPIHRRAAKANLQRRQLELRQLMSQLQATIETLHAEVEVAVREVETCYREMLARHASMLAADADVRQLQRRWETLPGDDRAASFLLEDLLDAQDRLAVEEFGYVQTQVEYTLSLTRLKRATGTLLIQEQIHPVRASENCLPRILLEKGPSAVPVAQDQP